MNRNTAIAHGTRRIQEAMALRDFEGAQETIEVFSRAYPESPRWEDLQETLEALKLLSRPMGSQMGSLETLGDSERSY